MKHIEDEFNDDSPSISGSNADCGFDEEEALYYAELLNMERPEVPMQ